MLHMIERSVAMQWDMLPDILKKTKKIHNLLNSLFT